MLGMAHARGMWGLSPSATIAVYWYSQGAAAGLAEAQFRLGVLYEHGQGVGQDKFMAAEWYAEAAAQGHVDAAFAAGVAYSRGRGVPRDHAAAVYWCAPRACARRRAAARGRLAARAGGGRRGGEVTLGGVAGTLARRTRGTGARNSTWRCATPTARACPRTLSSPRGDPRGAAPRPPTALSQPAACSPPCGQRAARKRSPGPWPHAEAVTTIDLENKVN